MSALHRLFGYSGFLESRHAHAFGFNHKFSTNILLMLSYNIFRSLAHSHETGYFFPPNKMFLLFVAVNDRGYIPYSCLGNYLHDYPTVSSSLV